jgi:hypothetical protein
LAYLGGAPWLAARVLLVTVGLGFVVLLPGALGILTRGTAVGCAIALAGAASIVPRVSLASSRASSESLRDEPAPAKSPGRVSATIATLAVLATAAWILAELFHALGSPPSSVDLISYDLPVIGRWIQTGSIWHITELFPLQTHGTYPQNAHLVLAAAAILPFHNDALLRFVNYPFLPFAGVAVYGIARELRAPAATATTFAAMFAAFPTIASDVEAGPLDTVALAAFASGVLFLVRHMRNRRSAELVLAALGLGFAAGAKWYLSSAVAALVAIWAVWSLVAARDKRRELLRAGSLILIVCAASGFWLVRNLVQAGDPFYPVRVTVFGVKIFNAAPDIYRAIAGWSIAHYLGDPAVLRHYIGPALRKALGLPGLLTLAGVVWALVSSSARLRRRPRRSRDNRLLFLAASAVVLAVIYVLTPYTAFGLKGRPVLAWVNVRYLIPALVLAVPATAAVVGRVGRQLRHVLELAALAATLQGLRQAYDLLATGHTALAAGVAVVLTASVAAWLWRAGAVRAPALTRSPATTTAVALASAVALLTAGYAVQRRLNRDRYGSADPAYAWIDSHGAGHKIGLAGSWDFNGISPAWPMFGARIGNQVAFVGRLYRGQLTQYRRRSRWLQAVRQGRYDLVLIARNPPQQGTFGDELRWAAEARLPIVISSQRFELVRTTRAGPT